MISIYMGKCPIVLDKQHKQNIPKLVKICIKVMYKNPYNFRKMDKTILKIYESQKISFFYQKIRKKPINSLHISKWLLNIFTVKKLDLGQEL